MKGVQSTEIAMEKTKPHWIFIIGFLAGGIACAMVAGIVYGIYLLQKDNGESPSPSPSVVGIGTPVACGSLWTIKVIDPPISQKEFSSSWEGIKMYAVTADGIFMGVKLEVTYNGQGSRKISDHLQVGGIANGTPVLFGRASSVEGLFIEWFGSGFVSPKTLIPQGMTLNVVEAFDVDPDMKDPYLLLTDDDPEPCQAKILLEQ